MPAVAIDHTPRHVGSTGTIYFGPSSAHLAEGLRRELSARGEFQYVDAMVRCFPDGETCVDLGPTRFPGPAVIIQGTQYPQNEHLQQLYQMVDVANARRGGNPIVCVLPYFAYGRQDRPFTLGEPATADLILRTLTMLGCNTVVTVDMHNPSIRTPAGMGISDFPAAPLLGEVWKARCWEDVLWVSPDAGGR